MCAIAGIFGNNKDDGLTIHARIEQMLKPMQHRGPDGHGIFIDAGMGLGHLRLNVIDLSQAGDQPMQNKEGTVTLVFNGAIFNYIELRAELEKLGYNFQSNSDTETIIHAYEEWGTSCVKRLNGMWAFALWDKRLGRFFASRDRFGIKPFFFFKNGSGFAFASEIKGILATAPSAPRVNGNSLYHYLGMDNDTFYGSTETLFLGIQTLPAAHNLIWESGKMHLERYWGLCPRYTQELFDYQRPKEAFRALLIDAVKIRLRSNVPLGICLSGGLDSSVITLIISELFGQKINTFSSIYRIEGYNEEEFVDTVAKNENIVSHKLFPDSKDFFLTIHKLILHTDEPVRLPQTFSHWRMLERASRDVTVVLSGHGSDELLGGYSEFLPSYLMTLAFDAFKNIDYGKLKKFLETVRAINHSTERILAPSMLKIVSSVVADATQRRWQNKVLSEDFIRHHDSFSRETPRIFPEEFTHHLFRSFFITHLPMALDFEDRIGMAFSLESRMPFLDHRLVEFCFGLSYQEKINGLTTKVILREAFKDILPDKIYNRKDKKALPTPMERWFRKELKNEVQEVLFSRQLREGGIFDSQKVQRLFEEHLAGKNNTLYLWRVLVTELWMRNYGVRF